MIRPAIAIDRVMGTSMHVAAARPDRLAAAKAAADRVVAAIDRSCSRFREDSELSALHRERGRDVTISPLLARALRVALRAARLTDGLVDPTVGAALRASGYDSDFESVAPVAEPLDLFRRPVPGWERIHLDDARRRVFLPGDVEIDLGSTGKALAADMAAEAAATEAGCGVLVSLGGDIATAGAPPVEGWHIQVAEDSAAEADPDAETIAIRSGAVATSSTTVRRWTRGTATLHHIIDPRTGLPAAGPWRTVSVVAASCVDANTASTAAIVRGEDAPRWLTALGLPSRLVDAAGEVVRCAGWPVPA
ncbi:MAG TPA: FAD:protein FMN transferase [Candidatus Binatia bacterium]|nr:FAD:protein FMN transferase [Candidatus Binatia bacterium]